VLQDLVEQVVQPDEDSFNRLAPPPMPNDESIFRASGEPQSGQAASFCRPMGTRHSKRRPHFLQANS